MDIQSQLVNGVNILRLRGRFDADGVRTVAKWFDEHLMVARVVFNLQGVNFIDSSGLSTMVKGLKLCRKNGGDLHLCGMQQAVMITIELTRLDKAFTIFEDEDKAVRAFFN
jgi:anti-sigma B factor antagonist